MHNQTSMYKRCKAQLPRFLVKPALALGSAYFIAACVPEISNPFSKYDVAWPAEGERVIDNKLSENTSKVVVSLPNTQRVPVYFNGQNHDACFTHDGNEISADLSCLAPFARQGENTINVNPSALLNSYTRTFIIDSEGPQVNLHTICYAAGADCEINEAGDVSFTVTYGDPSGLQTTTVNVAGTDYSPETIGDNEASFTVPVSDKYVFNSTDVNGFSSTHTYQKHGARLDPIFNVRIDEAMLAELIPLINKGVSGMESGNPDGSEKLLEDIEIQAIGIVNLLADVKYIKINNFEMKNLSINNGNADLETNLTMEPAGENGVDWTSGDGNVNTDDVGIEVMMSVQDVLWCTDPLGWIPACQPCKHSAFEMCQPGLIKMDMHMFIEKMDVNARINNNMVTEGKFHIKLEKQESGDDVLVMHDTFPVMDGSGNVSGDQATGIIGDLISGPLLRGIILDIVEDTINRNLDELVLESGHTTDNEAQAEMALVARVDNISTDLGLGNDNIGNMNIKLSGIFDTIKADPTIKPALGSYHVDDTNLPSPVDDGSSLSVVVNSNMINQALLAAYNIGITHLTVLNGKVLTGYQVSEKLGRRGDFKVELNPSSPGQFHLQGSESDKGQASIAFKGAEAIVSYRNKDGWQKVTSLNVDIRAGVYLTVDDGLLKMTLLSSPEMIVNDAPRLDLGSIAGIPIGIDARFIISLAQKAIDLFAPAVTDSALTIDVSKLGISGDLCTAGIDTSKGHLEFKQALGAQCPTAP